MFAETVTSEADPDVFASAFAALNIGTITPDCGRSNPSITIVPKESSIGYASSVLSYIVTVTNNDSPSCNPSTFNIRLSLPKSKLIQFGNATGFNLTIPPGQSAFKEVKIAAESTIRVNQTFDFVATVVNVNAPCFGGNALGSFTVDGSIVAATYCCQGKIELTKGQAFFGCRKVGTIGAIGCIFSPDAILVTCPDSVSLQVDALIDFESTCH